LTPRSGRPRRRSARRRPCRSGLPWTPAAHTLQIEAIALFRTIGVLQGEPVSSTDVTIVSSTTSTPSRSSSCLVFAPSCVPNAGRPAAHRRRGPREPCWGRSGGSRARRTVRELADLPAISTPVGPAPRRRTSASPGLLGIVWISASSNAPKIPAAAAPARRRSTSSRERTSRTRHDRSTTGWRRRRINESYGLSRSRCMEAPVHDVGGDVDGLDQALYDAGVVLVPQDLPVAGAISPSDRIRSRPGRAAAGTGGARLVDERHLDVRLGQGLHREEPPNPIPPLRLDGSWGLRSA